MTKLTEQQEIICAKHIIDYFVTLVQEHDYMSYHEIEEDIAYEMEKEGIKLPDEDILSDHLDTISNQIVTMFKEEVV